ncbi:uncharacterized protein VTP21DRAFT_3791 [Calcarisporiella thermophila]|uniref:uncharacterized protein n=1 Tax=Calcarisporiella thermophila TaxID=911321 RepID=UPI00374268AC
MRYNSIPASMYSIAEKDADASASGHPLLNSAAPTSTSPSTRSRSFSNTSDLSVTIEKEDCHTVQVHFAGYVKHNHSNSLFRKARRDFCVLTNAGLYRFKSQQKAEQVFTRLDPAAVIPAADVKIPSDSDMILTKHIYGVYRPAHPGCWALKILHFHPVTKVPMSIAMVLDSEHELGMWVLAFRRAVQRWLGSMVTVTPTNQQMALERMRRVKDLPDRTERILLQKVALLHHPNLPHHALKKAKQAPTLPNVEKEILGTEPSLNVCLAIGRYNLYLLPGASAPDPEYVRVIGQEDRHGLLSIVEIRTDGGDDTIHLSLRRRNGVPYTITLVTSFASQVIKELVRSIDTLTHVSHPHQRGYRLSVPDPQPYTGLRPLLDMGKLPSRGFQVSLEAHCAGSAVNASRIKVELTPLEQGVRVQLLPPEAGDSQPYNRFELLAFFRAVRGNLLFREVVVRDVSLADLEHWIPREGDGWATFPDSHQSQHDVNMLASELYALVISNRNLRKLDLTACGILGAGQQHAAISVIGSAMCTKQVGLNALYLGGNRILSEDLRKLVEGIRSNRKAIREFSLEGCGLDGREVAMLLAALLEGTPEHLTHLDLGGNALERDAREWRAQLDELLHRATRLRTLNLGGYSAIETVPLHLTLLRQLDVSGVRLGDAQIHFLTEYLASDAGQGLERLAVEACHLHGGHLAQLFHFALPKMHLSAGRNPLARELAMLPKFSFALLNKTGPESLSLAHTEWDDSTFRELAECLARNVFLKRVDLEGVRILGGASEDSARVLKLWMRENTVLEELSVRGCSRAAAKEGDKGQRVLAKLLVSALPTLAENRSLRKLDLTGLGVGDAGAMAMAEALRHNTTLHTLNMDANEITMEGFSALLHGITENSTLLHFAKPSKDVWHQVQILSEEIMATYQYEQEMRFFLAHSTGADARRTKENVEVQIQGRKAAELTRSRIGPMVDEICAMVERNWKNHRKAAEAALAKGAEPASNLEWERGVGERNAMRSGPFSSLSPTFSMSPTDSPIPMLTSMHPPPPPPPPLTSPLPPLPPFSSPLPPPPASRNVARLTSTSKRQDSLGYSFSSPGLFYEETDFNSASVSPSSEPVTPMQAQMYHGSPMWTHGTASKQKFALPPSYTPHDPSFTSPTYLNRNFGRREDLAEAEIECGDREQNEVLVPAELLMGLDNLKSHGERPVVNSRSIEAELKQLKF